MTADFNDRVAAVVVTYNRKDLLRECLDALLAQTYPLATLILVDNASTDGTPDMLRQEGYLDDARLRLVQMDTNTGGAGGFYEGLRQASQLDVDWAWVMDDDTIPASDALAGLVVAAHTVDEHASFFASCVYGPQGEPMNVPNIDQSKAPNGYKDWYAHLPQRAVRIADATFVSLLIRRDAVTRCGLPCKDYFIWGDDTEYTMRLIRNYGPAYLVGSSSVTHMRFNAKSLSLRQEDNPGRVRMYRYFYRNNLINRKLYLGKGTFIRFLGGAILTSFGSLGKPLGGAKFHAVWQGIGGYLSERKKFSRYIADQLQNGAGEPRSGQ